MSDRSIQETKTGLLDRLLIFLYLPVLNRRYSKRNREPTERVAIGIGWLIKSPVEFTSVYIVCLMMAAPSSNNPLAPHSEVNELLISFLVVGFWELFADRVVKLDVRLLKCLEQRNTRQRAEKYLRLNPVEAKAEMVFATFAMIGFVAIFAFGGAFLVLT